MAELENFRNQQLKKLFFIFFNGNLDRKVKSD